jgi:chromatin modification-related protein EAF6
LFFVTPFISNQTFLISDSVVDNLKKSNTVAELEKLREKKAQIEAKLESLEKQIYALEGSYLVDTRHLGNILTGWDSYLTSRSGALKRPMKFKDADRLFSLSSVTSMRVSNLIFCFKLSQTTSQVAPDSPEVESPILIGITTEERSSKQQKISKKQGPGRPRKVRADEEEYY